MDYEIEVNGVFVEGDVEDCGDLFCGGDPENMEAVIGEATLDPCAQLESGMLFDFHNRDEDDHAKWVDPPEFEITGKACPTGAFAAWFFENYDDEIRRELLGMGGVC